MSSSGLAPFWVFSAPPGHLFCSFKEVVEGTWMCICLRYRPPYNFLKWQYCINPIGNCTPPELGIIKSHINISTSCYPSTRAFDITWFFFSLIKHRDMSVGFLGVFWLALIRPVNSFLIFCNTFLSSDIKLNDFMNRLQTVQ